MRIRINNPIDPRETYYLPEIELHKVYSDINKGEAQVREYTQQEPRESYRSTTTSDSKSVYWILSVIGVLLISFVFYMISQQWSEPVINQFEAPISQTDTAVLNKVTYSYDTILTNEARNQGCVIVTGTFKNPKNITAMTDLIESLNYKVYRSNNNGLVRVGLRFDCNDTDLDAYLFNIREQIATKSWYLIPDYRPVE